MIRKKLPQPFDQLSIDDDWFRYECSAIATNIEYMTLEEIFIDYNQRCDIENNIDELKEGFAFAQSSHQNKKCNELFLLIKMFAFNLSNFFKMSFMPEEVNIIKSRLSEISSSEYLVICSIAAGIDTSDILMMIFLEVLSDISDNISRNSVSYPYNNIKTT